MGVIKVIKVVVGRRAEVAEPVTKADMTFVNMIASHIAHVPRDGTSLLFCLAMSLTLCFVVILAIVPRSSLQNADVKEESVDQKESGQKDTLKEVGDLMCEIIDTETEQDDTEDETVSKGDTKPFDEPSTPTMSPPTETIEVKEADKNSIDAPAPSIPDMAMTRINSRSRRVSLAAKAKSIGGSMRRLKFGKSKN